MKGLNRADMEIEKSRGVVRQKSGSQVDTHPAGQSQNSNRAPLSHTPNNSYFWPYLILENDIRSQSSQFICRSDSLFPECLLPTLEAFPTPTCLKCLKILPLHEVFGDNSKVSEIRPLPLLPGRLTHLPWTLRQEKIPQHLGQLRILPTPNTIPTP